MIHYTTKQLLFNEVEKTCTLHMGRHITQIAAGLIHLNEADATKAATELHEDKRILFKNGRCFKRR